jgi:hypothetical protein
VGPIQNRKDHAGARAPGPAETRLASHVEPTSGTPRTAKTFAVPGLGPWLDANDKTLMELSEQTGLSHPHLSRLRHGKRRASLGALLLLSQAVPLAELGAFDDAEAR